SIARKLMALRPTPLIVFVTAYSEHAVAAFELYAVDYLLKPFDDDRLAQCLARLEFALENQAAMSQAHEAQSNWAGDASLHRLVIKSSAAIRIIEIDQIRWIAANGNYVDIHHQDGKHLLRASMKHVLSKLPPGAFIQVHRGYAVRFDLIRELKNQDNDRAVITLATDETLPVGKSFRQPLLDRLCQEV
ncbi:MAG: LytTR family DNA-binding domain-containing protein, partial [Pseudomonadota bacterium]